MKHKCILDNLSSGMTPFVMGTPVNSCVLLSLNDFLLMVHVEIDKLDSYFHRGHAGKFRRYWHGIDGIGVRF